MTKDLNSNNEFNCLGLNSSQNNFSKKIFDHSVHWMKLDRDIWFYNKTNDIKVENWSLIYKQDLDSEAALAAVWDCTWAQHCLELNDKLNMQKYLQWHCQNAHVELVSFLTHSPS